MVPTSHIHTYIFSVIFRNMKDMKQTVFHVFLQSLMSVLITTLTLVFFGSEIVGVIQAAIIKRVFEEPLGAETAASVLFPALQCEKTTEKCPDDAQVALAGKTLETISMAQALKANATYLLAGVHPEGELSFSKGIRGQFFKPDFFSGMNKKPT